VLVVPDALAGLQALARHVYAQDRPLTFGVTGSSGKTSTKDLFAQVLSAFGETLAPVGSFNNEIGFPLTATQRTATTRYAALEYSARGVGHIAFLCGIVRPDVSVVLNVGTAHLGEFGSQENIAVAKGELVDAATTLAVLNADDPLVAAMASRASVPVVTFGSSGDYRADDVVVDDEGRGSFTLRAPQGSAAVQLQVRGEHQVSNALAVAAAVLAAGVTDDVARIAELLGAAKPVSRWRMEVTDRADGVTVVNDAYNANPDSMRAALKTLAVMSRGKTRRTWAVLGPMAELGDDARTAHMDLGRFVVRLDVSRLLVIGSEAAGIHAGAVLEGSWGEESVHVDDVDAAVALLREQVRPGDVVLVKASRSAGLERVAAALLEGAQ
jgi:UDP-N-acetylmuramoyl-tripeptide--D-alanyl-D-alanine ligase